MTKDLRPQPDAAGLYHARQFTEAGKDPFDLVAWERRSANISDKDGSAIFEQEDVEFPKEWSQNATNIVVQNYFRGPVGDREQSIRQVIGRVVDTIDQWAKKDGYFRTEDDRAGFRDDLKHILLHQKAAFNSPVWFNVGIEPKPQCSACFINRVEDTMESILELARTEGMLFKFGSGTGTNLSALRSSRETLAGGGTASGPVSFMKGYDAFAGVIKSGGKTRRAAKMVILDAEHPDILDFIECKVNEERKAWALIDAGYDGSFTGAAYNSVFFQNSNNSVRVPDAFMRAVADDGEWQTRKVTGDREVVETHRARDLMRAIAKAAHVCGDPGMQFDTTINDWHTCPRTDRIYASNPCCFVGETEVITSEGRIRIDALARMDENKLPMAVTHDPVTRLPVLRRIRKAWKAGKAVKLAEVVTEKGLHLRCTPEHQFYLRDGRAVPAGRLIPGQRLCKVGLSENKQRGCRDLLQHRTTERAPNGCSIYSRWLWEQTHGAIPDDHHIHHRNGVPNDDRVSNLELTHKTEHTRRHAQGENNPRFIDTPTATLIEVWDEIEAARPGWTVTPTRWNKHINDKGLHQLVAKANAEHGIRGMNWNEFAGWVDGQRDLVNDKVKSVRLIDVDPTAVYDLEVDEVHRFAVSSPETTHGAVVSNSEYMFLDDSACNLASLNLTRFRDPKSGAFDIEAFRAAVRTMITAQEIIVGNASYPTKAIERNSHDYRPLGLGYANLGALLMSWGLPYDSDAGRAAAAAITALMTGEGYAQSARIARECGGPFEGFPRNRHEFLEVMGKHRTEAHQLEDTNGGKSPLQEAAAEAWDEAVRLGNQYGYRNAQATVLAPTGTIAFLMDCDTTGVEPDIALVKRKKLAGGGEIRIVNQTVPTALRKLGYDEADTTAILEYIEEHGTIEGADKLDPKDLAVFDCAFKPRKGNRSIHYRGHLKMVAATQPFISGAISKTINLPNEATVDEMEQAYIEGWKLGLKAVALYRNGSKRTQPLTTDERRTEPEREPDAGRPIRRKLPDERAAITHKFDIAGHEGYITAGMYKDGKPGEVFLVMAKEGSTISGFGDSFAQAISYALQYGVPLQVLVDKFSHQRFEPAGMTRNPDVRIAKSIVDYMFRWMATKFLSAKAQEEAGVNRPTARTEPDKAEPDEAADATAEPETAEETAVTPGYEMVNDTDAPPCSDCGAIMIRSGTCYRCMNCGATSGCG